ncbi:FAD-dependent monooxygenase [Streptomyces coeruleoprunus]|uniref:FAD-dependent monooxygenase n=1 Tax=Streptomyces coeruleoprunus TaxID=285563 RepID=A0ABV9X9J7_9ACTN
MRQSRAVVIGGGVGGLTAAVALHRLGWSVTVLEAARTLAPVGAGIGLAPNAHRALDVIGLGDAVRDLATWHGDGGIRTPSGRWLVRSGSEAATARFGGPLVTLHRATLVEILRSGLPDSCLRLDCRSTLADPGAADRPAVVATPHGDLEADLVVGADGIDSRVRRVLFPTHPGPRYAGFTAWRIVVPAPERAFPPHETWGRGGVWGSHLLKDGRVYAYATAVVPEGGRSADGEKAELRRRFADWHDPIPDLLAAADPEGVLRHDVRQLAEPLPAYHRGRTALLGDAAHAMTPTLGQGGNQAIEDAVVLAHHVSGARHDGRDPGRALAAYTRDRLPRTTAIVRQAARTARLNHLTSPLLLAVRDALVAGVGRFGPDDLMLRSFASIADWRPPRN